MTDQERIARLENHIDVLNQTVYQLLLEVHANNPSIEYDDYGEISGIDGGWDKSHTHALVEKARSLPFINP